jgi:hypothetical protein
MPGHRSFESKIVQMSSKRHGPMTSKGLLNRKVKAYPDFFVLFRGCIAIGMVESKEIPPDFDSLEISAPHPA